MAKGGFRPGAGRPKGAKDRAPRAPKSASTAQVPDAGVELEAGPRRTPLEYMLDVMNDPMADPGRRDRMAIAAAPFQHARAPEDSKKIDKKKAAEAAGSGRFAPPAPPKLVVNNGT